jgi:omega-hydroxy-beta-dihydromenaquinone-9 sulfotransferase
VRWLGALDQKLGGRLAKMSEAIQDRFFRSSDRYHRIRLEEVEEDEVIFLHACASELLGNAFPIPEIWREYRHFDQLPDPQRRALMDHYYACVQRHMRLQGRGRRFVSKNQPFCHKIHSLRQRFPDAGFIMLVRHPAESVCSLLSMLDSFRSSVGLKAKHWEHPRRDPGALDFSVDCYRHALAALDQLPPEKVLIIRYEELVRSPKAVLQQIYTKFGMEVGPAYAAELDRMQKAAEGYQSRHHYSPEQFGLRAAEIRAMIPEIYERFGYGVEPG